MLVKEFISETNKNQMISTLLKHYNVGSVRVRNKSMKRHADYDVDRGVLNLSTRYKKIKPSKIKEFLITILHEIDHATDRKKMGAKRYEKEYTQSGQDAENKGRDFHDDNAFEEKAEKWARKEYSRKWKQKFK